MRLYVEAEEGEQGLGLVVRNATPADIIAVVRRLVESGTIEGAEFEADPRYGVWIKHDGKLKTFSEHFDPGTYLVVGPI